MTSPIDQEIEVQINLNWVQFWRDNERTFLILLENEKAYAVKETAEEIYKAAFRSGINEAFRQASLAAEQELKKRNRIGGF